MASSGVVSFEGTYESAFTSWWRTQALSTAFSVVAILGSHSGGKSTLLNALFGTRFEVMDHDETIGQTTKGIWAATDAGLGGQGSRTNSLVVDVEGNDSADRGNNRNAFGNWASLFALAIADVLFINMNFKDLGRHNASGFDVLSAIFEVNFDVNEVVFANNENPTSRVVFIVRDSLGDAANVKRRILGDVDKLWKGVPKPEQFEGLPVGRFFYLDVVCLPNFVYQRAEFNSAVEELRAQWLSWRPEKFSRGVHADDFPTYVERMWNSIRASGRLNVPEQLTLIATERCHAIASKAEQFDIPPSETFPESVKTLQRLGREAVAEYDKTAIRYEEGAYLSQREELKTRLQTRFQSEVDISLASFKRRLLDEADAELALDRPTCSEVDTCRMLDSWTKRYQKAYDDGTSGLKFDLSDTRIPFVMELTDKVIRHDLEASLKRRAEEEKRVAKAALEAEEARAKIQKQLDKEKQKLESVTNEVKDTRRKLDEQKAVGEKMKKELGAQERKLEEQKDAAENANKKVSNLSGKLNEAVIEHKKNTEALERKIADMEKENCRLLSEAKIKAFRDETNVQKVFDDALGAMKEVDGNLWFVESASGEFFKGAMGTAVRWFSTMLHLRSLRIVHLNGTERDAFKAKFKANRCMTIRLALETIRDNNFRVDDCYLRDRPGQTVCQVRDYVIRLV